MQASSVKEPFDSPDWIFETKLDGYRAIAVIDPANPPAERWNSPGCQLRFRNSQQTRRRIPVSEALFSDIGQRRVRHLRM
jgi:bifunctional non-homologous end joining protein LigD